MPTKIVSAMYPDLPMHIAKGIGMRRKCFGHLPFTTDACQEVYPYPPKLFREFMVTVCGRLAKAWGYTENVLVFYHSLLTEACQEVHPYPPTLFRQFMVTCMRMHRKCFGNLPFPTDGCVEVYPYPPKSFRQFTVTYRCMSPNVWVCTENVSVIYHSPPTHAGKCIAEIVLAMYGDLLQQAGKGMGIHRKSFGHLPFPTEARKEFYPYPPKLFQKFMVTCMRMHRKCFSNFPFPTDGCAEVHPSHRNRFGNLP